DRLLLQQQVHEVVLEGPLDRRALRHDIGEEFAEGLGVHHGSRAGVGAHFLVLLDDGYVQRLAGRLCALCQTDGPSQPCRTGADSACAKGLRKNTGSGQRITERSTRFSSSRTFPGQGYSSQRRIDWRSIVANRLPTFRENRSTKAFRSGAISAGRSRSGGTRI